MTDELLADQIEYYRARAGEYDEWWNRKGRYDKGDDFAAKWRAEVDQVTGWLDELSPTGDVLELAGGTGNWTVELARHADRLTVVDASPETLEINRAKVGDAIDADYVVADLFAWEPPRQFDLVFSSFWITHVPDERLAELFDLIDRALKPGGRVAMLDNKGGQRDEPNVVESAGGRTDRARGLSERMLNDGRTFTIVKRFRSPAVLAEQLGPLGWDVAGKDTESFFTWAVATRT